MPAASQTVRVVNQKGLHARASAKLARLAATFKADVRVSHNGNSADARSIMDMLLLAAAIGSEVSVSAEGEDAGPAVEAIVDLIADGFGEEDAPPTAGDGGAGGRNLS